MEAERKRLETGDRIAGDRRLEAVGIGRRQKEEG
jgi:hypothetical protein